MLKWPPGQRRSTLPWRVGCASLPPPCTGSSRPRSTRPRGPSTGMSALRRSPQGERRDLGAAESSTLAVQLGCMERDEWAALLGTRSVTGHPLFGAACVACSAWRGTTAAASLSPASERAAAAGVAPARSTPTSVSGHLTAAAFRDPAFATFGHFHPFPRPLPRITRTHASRQQQLDFCAGGDRPCDSLLPQIGG
jgi:hypothetical protein